MAVNEHLRVPPIFTVIHLLLLAGICLALVSVCLNLAHFRSLAPAKPPSEAPLISVLVPARNEARSIERCVRSLLAQDWPALEVIVLDDGSSDGTGEILRGIKDPKLQVVSGAELPAGWVGKNWACHQLSEMARGEWLLFTDADTEHAPGTISAAFAHARQTRADLLSAWPRLVTRSLGEQLIVPIILFVGMVFYPHALITHLQRHPVLSRVIPRRVSRHLGAANGQFLFFRRSAYRQLGGHAALHDHLVEDVAFGRAVTERMRDGMRLENCDALRFSTCRMYHSLAETWYGFTKNSRAVFEGNVAAFLFLGLAQFTFFCLPFFGLFLPRGPRALVLLEIGGILLIRSLLAARFKTSWLSVALHPVGLLMTLAIGIHSAFRSSFGGVEWKGRRYLLLKQRSSGALS